MNVDKNLLQNWNPSVIIVRMIKLAAVGTIINRI
jgi:hypothetical protein